MYFDYFALQFLVLRNMKKRELWKLGKGCSKYPANNSAFSIYVLNGVDSYNG